MPLQVARKGTKKVTAGLLGWQLKGTGLIIIDNATIRRIRMGQYDKQIKAAKKIGEDWIKTSKEYEAKFIEIKKLDIKLCKDFIAKAQEAIVDGHRQEELDKHKKQLEETRGWLEGEKEKGEKLFEKHHQWSIKEPRQSMSYMDKTLKLGGVGSEAYEAVSEACKRQLTEVAVVLSTTEKAWHDDVLIAIENQLDRLEAVLKVLKGESSKQQAFMEQIKKEAKRFVDTNEQMYNALKVDSALMTLEKVLTGKQANNTDTDKKINQQNYHLYETKIAAIPKVIALIEKNHGRVLKSVPKKFMDGFSVSGERKMMEEKKKEILGKLKQASDLFTKLRQAYEKMNLV
jgi:hypothetical protein